MSIHCFLPVTNTLNSSELIPLMTHFSKYAHVRSPSHSQRIPLVGLPYCFPHISLDEMLECLSYLSSFSLAAILTDGRSITQRLTKSLGLSSFPAIFDDYSDTKPSPLRYEFIMKDFPAQAYFYIADNPKKDFLAPNHLGWQTVGLLGSAFNIHSQDVSHLNPDYLPSFWINSLLDLLPNSIADLPCI